MVGFIIHDFDATTTTVKTDVNGDPAVISEKTPERTDPTWWCWWAFAGAGAIGCTFTLINAAVPNKFVGGLAFFFVCIMFVSAGPVLQHNGDIIRTSCQDTAVDAFNGVSGTDTSGGVGDVAGAIGDSLSNGASNVVSCVGDLEVYVNAEFGGAFLFVFFQWISFTVMFVGM